MLYHSVDFGRWILRGGAVVFCALSLACAPKEEAAPEEAPAEAEPEAHLIAPEKTADTASAQVEAAPVQAGRVIHVDAEGNRIQSSPGAVAAPSRNRSSEGLVVEKSSAPGGGLKVDLKGRFRSYSVATVQPDGSVKVDCLKNLDPDHDHSKCIEGEEQ